MTAEIVDSLVNAFTPDREARWRAAIAGTGSPVKVHDEFVEPVAMVERMDELGVATLVLPAVTPSDHAFDGVAVGWTEVEALVQRWPGRFAALAVVDPTLGSVGVRATTARLAEPWVVGLYLHTHSWDRRFDHADYYPYYAVCAELDVPVVMQAGASGGPLPSECGRPAGIDRPAIYFPETRFVLSHLGWPWSDEAVAMASKFPNVYLGTGSWPPRRWGATVTEFLRGGGSSKVLFATNFPTVSHRQALAQVDELDLAPATSAALLGGTARTVFTRLGGAR